MRELSAKLLQLCKDIETMKVDISVGLKNVTDQQKVTQNSVFKDPTNPPLSPETASRQDEDQANHTQADHTQANVGEEDLEQDMSIVSETNTIDENVTDNLLTNSLNSQLLTTQL